MRWGNVWRQQSDSLLLSPPPARHILFIHRNSTWLKLPSVETYHSHPQLLDGSHWAVQPMPSIWVGREPPGRPGLMSPWASKPRGPVALGNVANHGCTLAMLPPPLPPIFPLSLRTVKAKRRLMVANCAARGSGVLGSMSVGSSGLASIRMCALRPLPITTLHRVWCVYVFVR